MTEMTDNITEHFEDLWNKAEEISSKQSKSATYGVDEILSDLTSMLEDYKNFHSLPTTPELIKLCKEKKFGEILFRLAELSAVDKVNTFAVLQLENKLQDTVNSSSNVSPTKEALKDLIVPQYNIIKFGESI